MTSHLNFPSSLAGHVDVVKLLVSRSADKSCKDKQGYTPLHAAAASGHIEIVKYLLRMGAEVSDCFIFFYLPKETVVLPALVRLLARLSVAESADSCQ